ncbi:hypothetical protein, variant 1 [Aphanomyces invadans]|uniref:Uncharacterized protein n=1 Tax=Aphanomyces invadans TaxID=157072 RepID=A0A024TLW3_9STRA|nr:hypothetical protein, variant 1 [Aphanomyces invadans]ETV94964.1 hypothetical protein, variant 1 [Aphanomyces invadans]|eukprot:XP_008876556.1 hypothetical protein, variant 1 [Aphanomyces invadans]
MGKNGSDVAPEGRLTLDNHNHMLARLSIQNLPGRAQHAAAQSTSQMRSIGIELGPAISVATIPGNRLRSRATRPNPTCPNTAIDDEYCERRLESPREEYGAAGQYGLGAVGNLVLSVSLEPIPI